MSNLAAKLGWFLRELRQRHVFETAVVYTVSTWLVLQVSDIAFPAFAIPDTALRYVFGAALAGFPIALVFAWMFDITPEGLTRTQRQREEASESIRLHRADFAVIGVLICVSAVIFYFMISRLMQVQDDTSQASSSVPDSSIAVLPFRNMSEDSSNEYFSDGMSEELMDKLVKLQGLHVAARTSSFYFKNKNEDVATIAQRLGVRTILEGSVRKADNRVRVTAQLINAQDGYHLWSQTFDRILEDIFEVQDEIADNIVRAVAPKLIPELESTRQAASRSNLEAYQLYQQGQHYWKGRSEDGIRKSIEYFQASTMRDPEFARAYSALATAYALLPEYTDESQESAFSKAEPTARRAIELEETQGSAHAILAYMSMRKWEWSEAEVEFGRALSLEPGNATIYQWYSNFLNDVGRHEEALQAAKRAYQLDPVSPVVNIVMAINYVWSGSDFDDLALKHTATARELGYSGSLGDKLDFIVRLRRKEFDEASEILENALAERGADNAWVVPFVAGLQEPQRIEIALEAVKRSFENEGLTAGDLYWQYILLDRPELAFALSKDIPGNRLPYVWFLLPEATSFRAHAEFSVLMENIGLLEYWRTSEPPDLCEPSAQGLTCR